MELSSSIQALASSNFNHLLNHFTNAGFAANASVPGILQLVHAAAALPRPRLLLSVGVHGDETAPIEIVAHALDALVAEPDALTVDLMLVVGNLEAIAQRKRFIDIDLNRLFRKNSTDLPSSRETARAAEIMHAAADFFVDAPAERWHLDLHTAIRASHYPAFAVVPAAVAGMRRNVLLDWLGRAGIGAAILSPTSAGTFSAYTAVEFGATSATVELGQVGELGTNNIGRFVAAYDALVGLMRTGKVSAGPAQPQLFRVTQELIKHSEAFRMAFGRDTPNFTPLQPGELIAQDGEVVYRVGTQTEYVVFPNPDVRIGLRAGVMVIRDS